MANKKSKNKKSQFTWADIAKNPSGIIVLLFVRPILPNEYVPAIIIVSMLLLGQALHTSFKLLQTKFPQLSGKAQTAKNILALILIGLIVITELSLALGLMIHFYSLSA